MKRVLVVLSMLVISSSIGYDVLKKMEKVLPIILMQTAIFLGMLNSLTCLVIILMNGKELLNLLDLMEQLKKLSNFPARRTRFSR